MFFTEKKNFFLSVKATFLLLLKKFQFFFYLFLVKTRLEIRFNNVLDRKETFFDYKNKIF